MFEEKEASSVNTREFISFTVLKNVYLECESRQPKPEDKVLIPPLNENSIEYAALIRAGVLSEDIKLQLIRRDKLQAAGFAFINFLSIGPSVKIEKPIINAVINGSDYSKKSFLSIDELNQVKEYQIKNGFILNNSSKKIRYIDDMLRLMYYGVYGIAPVNLRGGFNAFRLATTDDKFTPLENDSTEDRLLIKDYKKYLYEKLGEDYQRLFLLNNRRDIYPWSMETEMRFHGTTISHIDSRRSALEGTPSPFLYSGFVFYDNPDLTIQNQNGKVFRLNPVVMHLMNHGLAEMGDGGERSYDQHYLTPSEFEDIYGDISEEESKMMEQAVLLSNINEKDAIQNIHDKFLEKAHEWKQERGGKYTILKKISYRVSRKMKN